ncbi:MAG TPA: DUF2203 domain-containing protein [Trueperaceae bacterium]
MYRLFTLAEATDMIPTVDRLLGEMQDAARDIAILKERLGKLDPISVDARNCAQEIAFLINGLHSVKAELDRMGVHIKDVESGVVDFPSQLGAEVVCLSWEKGQDAITHYHRFGEDATKLLPHQANDNSSASF